MKTVREIYDFFLQYFTNGGKQLSLMDFMNTVPGFVEKIDDGTESMNMSMGMEYYKICEKMVEDSLLMRIKPNAMMSIMTEYLAVHSVNSSNPQVFNMELDYGIYDFKYRGFTYTYHYFKESVVPIVGKNANGDDDNGTAYYIGENRFVTAAHCVDGLERFNLLKPDGTPYALRAVLFAAGQNHNDYDLAVIVTDEVPVCQPLWLGDPATLDDVLVMGYPPIPGLNPVLTAETATVATSDKFQRKAVVGQVVAEAGTYFNHLNYFLISARVKGGNSGSPVINSEGRVVGTVIQLPFDSDGGFGGKRFDIMGFGVCLPSKYVDGLLANPDVKPLVSDNGYYRMAD